MKELILIVDDNKVNIKLLEKILNSEGYKTATAFGGKEGLEAVDRQMPDLILMDIMMPDIDGYEACRRLKNNELTGHIPIIFATSLKEKEERIKALKVGAEDFITRPFSREEIILRIENSLNLIRAKKELKETVENQALLLDHIDPLVWYMKDETTLGKVNKSFAAFFNKPREALENSGIRNLLTPKELEKVLHSNRKTFKTKDKTREKFEVTDGLGKRRLMAITKTPKINDRGEVDYIICTAEDITERSKKAEKMKQLSFYDSLTDLYNRTFYEEELKRLDVQRNLPLSMIICDVNGLKLANDIFGHQIGDQLLMEVAKILKKGTREDDIIARWGGDEFVVLLPNTSEEETIRVAERINGLLRDRSVGLIPLSIAIGIATKEEKGQDVKEIVKKAEDRMYRHKIDSKDDDDNPLLSRFALEFWGIEYKDVQHSPNLKKSGKLMGTAMNFEEEHKAQLDLLIKYHDIGKLSLPKDILNKGAVLSEEEWEQYKNHVEIGYRIANTFRSIGSIAEEVLHHHEHFDGNGYPGKLRGKEIPLLSRIMMILDFYDGLRTGIYYPLEKDLFFTNPLSVEAAIKELKKRSGTFFDPEILPVFIEKVIPKIEKKVGVKVQSKNTDGF